MGLWEEIEKEQAFIAEVKRKKEDEARLLTEKRNEYILRNRKSKLNDLIPAYLQHKNCNPEISKFLNLLSHKDVNTRKDAAQQLIKLLRADKFAAEILWKRLAEHCKTGHTGFSSPTHYDIPGGAYNCSSHADTREWRHEDYGIGITFPPYPFDK